MYYYHKTPKGGCRVITNYISIVSMLHSLSERHAPPSLDLNNIFAVDATVTDISDRVTVYGCNGVSWTFPVEETFGCDPFTVGSAVTLLMCQEPNARIQDSVILDVNYDHSV